MRGACSIFYNNVFTHHQHLYSYLSLDIKWEVQFCRHKLPIWIQKAKTIAEFERGEALMRLNVKTWLFITAEYKELYGFNLYD